MVLGAGFEPAKAVGRQIYSLLRLTASLPQREHHEIIAWQWAFTKLALVWYSSVYVPA